MDTAHDFGVLIDSSAALVLVETREEKRTLDLIRAVADERDLPVWTWSMVSGLTRDGGAPQYGTETVHKALAAIDALTAPGVFVLADGHHDLSDPAVTRRVKELVASFDRSRTLVITAPAHDVPPELTEVAHVWRLRPPSIEELRRLVGRTMADLDARGFTVASSGAAIEQIASSLTGLPLANAEHLLQQAAVRDGVLHEGDLPALRRAKAELFAGDGVLELIESADLTLADVGGLDSLKEWLLVRGSVLTTPVEGLPAPRGVLLTGVPGCGKSLAAKAAAAAWGVPLVLLDPGRLFDRFVGGSEGRLRGALEAVEAMAPAVLWIDEIEKGFSSDAASDGGVAARMLGTFLRWLQERPDGVFVVATANNVEALPPELLRRGRFDDVFFVDLPDDADRRTIIEIHLNSRSLPVADFDLDELVAATVGFSGAEIEAAIVAGMYRALGGAGHLDRSLLMGELERTVPLSLLRAEDIAELRAWARSRTISAD